MQHPATGYSNTISKNVEGTHKEFVVFHKNLKNLVMLYKTRHQLMESLNENGLYTAKCYNEMLDGTPLTSIVAPGGGRYKNASEDKAESIAATTVVDNAASFENAGESEANRTSQPKNIQEKLASIRHDEEIDMTEYPDSGVIRERLEPDEGSRIAQQLSKNLPTQEPEGVKASKMMSVNASTDSYLATISDGIEDVIGEKGTGKDPPSANSIASGDSIAGAKYERIESTDPPSAFPDDETELSVEKNPNWENDDSANSMAVGDMGGSLNIIVDDDEDSFIGNVSQEKETVFENNKKDNKEFANDFDEGKLVKEIVVFEEESKGKEIVSKNVDEEEPEQNPSFIANAEPKHGSVSNDEYSRSSESAPDDEKKGRDDTDYLNISNDGELVVIKGSPEAKSQPAPPSNSFTIDCSYFDVHKAEYKEMNSKLDEHFCLVEYVEEWMETVSTRVQSRYFEYGKHRSSLNHYASKVDSLLNEEEKLKEKNKPMKPKQIEKLERNQVKLTGARETHDNAGESLLMLMDEVILRSWRDAFPLLKKSISFECDFANITHKHMAKLGRSLELLDIIGDKESISMDGRLVALRNMNPEDIYTGSRDDLFAREE